MLKNLVSRAADGSVTIRMSAISSKVPQKSGVVRMTYYEGHYHLVPVSGGQVEVTYQAVLDPAGSIPAWVANMAVVDTPYDLLANMRKILTGK